MRGCVYDTWRSCGDCMMSKKIVKIYVPMMVPGHTIVHLLVLS